MSGASTLNACTGTGNPVPGLPGTYCNPSVIYFQYNGGYPVPVLLGTDMTLLVNEDFSDYADGYAGSTGGQGTSSYRFRLTELDGSSVSLIATPEPSGFGMLGAALLLFASSFRVYARGTTGA